MQLDWLRPWEDAGLMGTADYEGALGLWLGLLHDYERQQDRAVAGPYGGPKREQSRGPHAKYIRSISIFSPLRAGWR